MRLDGELPWSQIAMVLETAHQTRYQPPRPRKQTAPHGKPATPRAAAKRTGPARG